MCVGRGDKCNSSQAAQPPPCAHLGKEDAVKELVGLLLVLGDVSISMHSKHLWMRVDGERPHIVQVPLILKKKALRSASAQTHANKVS